jgi:hypothetical protein
MANKKDPKKIRAQILARAWKDPEFKKKLLANPRSVFKELGYELPPNENIVVHEDSKNTHHFILPSQPAQAREMSDADLRKIAGGDDTWPCTFMAPIIC